MADQHHNPDAEIAAAFHAEDADAIESQHPGSAATRYLGARRYVYNLLQHHVIETRLEHIVRFAIGALIILNVLAVVVETVQEVEVEIHGMLQGLEIFSVIVFSIEYVLRLWSAVEDPRYARPITGRLRYAFTFFALVDLLAIAPFFLHAFGTFDLRFIRGLRLIRLVRVMKLGRYSESLSLLVRVVRSKREDILVAMFVILLMLVLSSSLMYFLEHDKQPQAFPNIPAALWWGVATLTTVGYGDIYPVTALGKLCSAIIALLGIGLVALPSGLIVAGFVEELQSRKAPRVCPHCGKAP